MARRLGWVLLIAAIACGDDDGTSGDSGVDTGSGDTGPSDTGSRDTGSSDTGPGDTGPGDTGPGDTGPGDTGPGDTGPGDAGPGDAGMDADLPMSTIRFVHVAPGEDVLDVLIDDAPAGSIDRDEGTAGVSTASGSHTIRVRRSGESGDLFTVDVDLSEGETTSVALYGATPTGLVLVDDDAGISAAETRIRVAHVADGVGEVDLFVMGDPPSALLSDVAFEASGSVDAAPDAFRLGVDANDDTFIDLVFSVPALMAGALEAVYAVAETGGDVYLLAHRPDGSTLRIDADARCATLSHDGTVPLASTMNTAGVISEDMVTGTLAIIGRGDGTPGDADGLYLVTMPDMLVGSGLDVFPREEDFVVGSLNFDADGVTGCGVETVEVSALDLSELWTDGSATTDISDAALGLWFFSEDRTSMMFGELDASDTVTFSGGALTSVDVSITIAFSLVVNDTLTAVYDGTLSFAGDAFTIEIDDLVPDIPVFVGTVDSTMIFDLEGTLNAL
ncbi:MAG: DUF4397 domain-containing protein [Myxococcota bacterium]